MFRKSNDKIKRIDMTLDFIRSFVLESKILRSCKFVLQGGEYTEHPEYLEIARFFKNHDIETTLLTNCIEPEKVLALEPEVGAITVSYDGTPHDLVRGAPNNTEKIKYFLRASKRLVPITLQMTLGPWNMRSIAIHNFLMICSLYKTNARFNVAQSDGLLKNGNYEISDRNLSIINTHIKNIGRTLGVDTSDGSEYIEQVIASKKGKRLPCRSLSMYTTITANGDVLLCQGLEYTQAKVSNIYNNNFDIIWNETSSLRSLYKKCTACYLSCQLIGDLKYVKEQGELK